MTAAPRVLVAPDKLKGSLSAARVAEAMERGVRRVWPSAEVVLMPLADGGEGTVTAVVNASAGRVEWRRVPGPLENHEVDAPIGVLDDSRAVVEMAAASGLQHLSPSPLSALRASSFGTGRLIRMAADLAAPDGSVLVGVGGSASTDGGTGAARALGWRFVDRHGQDLEPGGGALQRLAHIDGHTASRWAGPAVVAFTDVDSPLLGPRGAARVFAGQKGAGPDEVTVLERGLEVLAERIRVDVGPDVTTLARAGAGGGMGAGLAAFFNAPLEPGFGAIASITGLETEIASADVVLTAEGRLDEQSLAGKAPVEVGRLCHKAGVTCMAVAGVVTLDLARLQAVGIRAAYDLTARVGRPPATADPAGSVELVTETLLRTEFA